MSSMGGWCTTIAVVVCRCAFARMTKVHAQASNGNSFPGYNVARISDVVLHVLPAPKLIKLKKRCLGGVDRDSLA